MVSHWACPSVRSSPFNTQPSKGVKSFRLQPSSEALLPPYNYLQGAARLPSTARIGQALFHRARSASKEGTWPLPLILPSSLVLLFTG